MTSNTVVLPLPFAPPITHTGRVLPFASKKSIFISSIGPMFLILTDLSSNFINILALNHPMARSLASRLDLRSSNFVNLEQSFEQRFEFVQRELGCRVAQRRRRV